MAYWLEPLALEPCLKIHTMQPLALTAALAVACSGTSGPVDPDGGNPGVGNPPSTQIELVVVATGLNSPVHLAAPPGDQRLFVVEQGGRIRIIQDGQLLGGSFLDISADVSSGGERGLLSLAFHPDYTTNGYFYVNYTDPSGDTRVVRYTVSGNPNLADAASDKLILTVAQPFGNHNGGLVTFGPDGMLYVGMGDGGDAGDPQDHGQDRNTLLGALLRIDVDGGDPYAIPPDNPFVGQAMTRDEIWAYGLRNPWRFSFDAPGGVMYVADVGQNRWEEVNAVATTDAGVNYGWRVMEGTQCFNPSVGCDQTGLELPVLEYSHSQGCSVTGGHAYRGSVLTGLTGHYFYGDYCSGWIRSFRLQNGEATSPRTWDLGSVGRITSFGVDAANELYVLSDQGTVYRFSEPPAP
jgi:glucose/arabinose dehydrogenase